ncbi:MAG: hypothetical protein GY906_37265 [bacterium]|nr:hypothetical protein [bacterium]
MAKGEIFVDGRDTLGQRAMLDVMDLDDESFRHFVVESLKHTGTVTYVPAKDPSEIIYQQRKVALDG